jgi:hypothetical protein
MTSMVRGMNPPSIDWQPCSSAASRPKQWGTWAGLACCTHGGATTIGITGLQLLSSNAPGQFPRAFPPRDIKCLGSSDAITITSRPDEPFDLLKCLLFRILVHVD